jgi:hypothetical protein
MTANLLHDARARLIGATLLFLISLVTTAAGGNDASTPPKTGFPVVYYIPVQSLGHDRGFSVAGAVPQLRSAGASGAAANRLLRSVVERGIKAAEAAVRPTSGPFVGGGEFTINPVKSLISLNPKLLSVLLPVTESRPHGTSSPYWLSVTTRLSVSSSAIGIGDVITNPGFDRLAHFVRSRLGKNNCVTTLGDGALAAATLPSAASFRQFALLPDGLAIGFPSGPSGPLYECGNLFVVIPYSELTDALSPSGNMLVKFASVH